MAQQRVPQIGDDVTAMMPAIGEDVSSLMASHEPESPRTEHPHARVARLVGENLPAIGGLLGGLAGSAAGPAAAIPLAGLGGAAGRLGQRVIAGVQRRPDAVTGLGEMAGDAALEGGKQAALEAVGGVVGKGLAAGGRRLYQGLAKPSKALRAEFPGLIDDALRERVPLTSGDSRPAMFGPGGARKIEGLVKQSADRADAMVRAEAPTAMPVRGREALSKVRPVVEELRKRVDIGQPSELATVGDRGKRLMARSKGGIELERAQQLKRTAQESAQRAYKARDMGATKQLGADDLMDEAIASGLREGIERRVPGIADVNRRTQSLIGVDRMVSDAIAREGNTLAVNGLRDLAAIGGGAGLGSAVGAPGLGVAGGVLLKLLSTPSTGSRAAILANDAARMGLPQHVLRALMLSSGDPE